MAALEDSQELTRTAISSLIGATLPPTLALDGVQVRLSSEQVGAERRVTCAWDRGQVQFRLREVRKGQRRDIPEDNGHDLGLAVLDGPGLQEVVWVTFEWWVRDGIRRSEALIPLYAWNAYTRRSEDEKAGRSIDHYGPLARQIAARTGLGLKAHLLMGTYSLESRTWDPDASTALVRLLQLSLIKAHFMDRGEGRTIEGVPLFSIAPRAAPILDPDPGGTRPAEERRSGIIFMAGPAEQYRQTLATLLERTGETLPPEDELRQWVQRHFGVSSKWASQLTRLLRTMGLLEEREGRLNLTEPGQRFLETQDGLIVYRSLKRVFEGFEEALLFFEARPGTGVPALSPFLNRVLEVDWESDTQARARVYWLVGCGLLSSTSARYQLTDTGRRASTWVADEVRRRVLEVLAEEGAIQSDGDEAEEPAPLVVVKPDDVKNVDLSLPPGVLERCCAALSAGKHLLLVGPPGTGKSTLAARLAEHAAEAGHCREPLLATASADWTTYDTIGGWTQQSDGRLTFREGVVTRALREQRWLVLDEVNRADIDKCFGELFTVLAGGTVTTPYTRHDAGTEVPVTIGPEARPYTFGPWFRLLATMNLRDKSSLFRLSYAFLRRFAVIHVPGLPDSALRALAAQVGSQNGVPESFWNLAATALSSEEGLGGYVPLGPSMLIDVIRYAAARGGQRPERAVGEGLELCVFPQLEGLGDGGAREVDVLLGQLFGADLDFAQELRASFRNAFPHLRFDG